MTMFHSRGGIVSAIFLFLAIIAISIELGVNFEDIYSISNTANIKLYDYQKDSKIEIVSPVNFADIKNTFKLSLVSQKNAVSPVSAPITKASESVAAKTFTEVVDNGTYFILDGRKLNVVEQNTTAVTPANSVARYVKGSRYPGIFYFAHNSTELFGSLLQYSNGDTFSIVLNGKTTKYRVSYAISVLNDEILAADMPKIARAQYEGVQYDVSLMTCDGDPLPDQNATMRRLIFANKV